MSAQDDIDALRRAKRVFQDAQALVSGTDISDYRGTKQGISRNIEQAISWIDSYIADQENELTPEEVALTLVDVSDHQGWDRLTWTGDPDEYAAINDDIPPPSAVDFARDLMSHFDLKKRA